MPTGGQGCPGIAHPPSTAVSKSGVRCHRPPYQSRVVDGPLLQGGRNFDHPILTTRQSMRIGRGVNIPHLSSAPLSFPFAPLRSISFHHISSPCISRHIPSLSFPSPSLSYPFFAPPSRSLPHPSLPAKIPRSSC